MNAALTQRNNTTLSDLQAELQPFTKMPEMQLVADLSALKQLAERITTSKCDKSVTLCADALVRIIDSYDFDLNKYRYAMHLQERVSWLDMELAAANPNALSEAPKLLQVYRELFAENETGYPATFSLIEDFRKLAYDEGPVHRTLHELLTYLNDPSCHSTSYATLRSKFREDCKHLEASNPLMKLANNIFDRIGDSFLRDCDLNKEHLAIGKEFQKRYLKMCSLDPSPFEQMRWGVYRPTGILPHPETLSKILELCNTRVIDPNKRHPQLGFGRDIMPSEIMESILLDSGALIGVFDSSYEPLQMYQLIIEPEEHPGYVRNCMKLLKNVGELYSDRSAWLSLTCSSSDGFKNLNSQGFSGYGFAGWIASHLLADQQIDKIYCSVRTGEQANTSIDIHLKHGWELTGIDLKPDHFGDGYSNSPATILRKRLYSPLRAHWYMNERKNFESDIMIPHKSKLVLPSRHAFTNTKD